MAYDQKNQAGRGPMMKTGRGIPMKFYGPMATQDGFLDDVKRGAKAVGQRLSAAADRASNKYYTNTSSSKGWGDFGGGGGRSQTTYNPVNYVTGFVQGLTSGESTAPDALSAKQRKDRYDALVAEDYARRSGLRRKK
jgi:hypothetical protein